MLNLLSRSSNIHKGNCGKILVVAGSPGMTGAAMLACKAAFRSGAGLVRLITPKKLANIVDIQLPEVITISAKETKQGTLARNNCKEILELSKEHDVLAIGPGLSSQTETKQLIKMITSKTKKPMVIDADALHHSIISSNHTKEPYTRIITPHLGEMSRLLNIPIKEIEENKKSIAKKAANIYKSIVVLKGHQTIVTDGTKIYRNNTGNPGMATAGMGDVLTGIISSFCGQGLSAWDAACFSVYIHGLAGDLAFKEKNIGLMASDIIELIPNALAND